MMIHRVGTYRERLAGAVAIWALLAVVLVALEPAVVFGG